MKPILAGCTLIAMLLSLACSEEEDRQEQVKKLRAIGVSANPVVSQPSTSDAPQTVTLTVYAAIPLGQDIEASVYSVENALFGIPLTTAITEGSAAYDDRTALRVFSVNATATIPSNDFLSLSGDDVRRLRFGIQLQSGGEVEKIEGDVIVMASDNSRISEWLAPEVTLDRPTTDETGSVDGELALEATVTNHSDQRVKVGWFVSNGEVENRRAKSTKWTPKQAGAATVIMTARGIQTRGFAFAVTDLTVQ